MQDLYNRLLEATNDKPKNIFLPPTATDLVNRAKQRIVVIANKLKKQGILNADGSYDFKGDVDIADLGLKNIAELGIKFGKVGGYFNCGNNQLTNLEGAPTKVGGYFYCRHNQLTSLEGAPQEVGGVFWCSYNQLTNLVGAPTRVGGYFGCDNNKLTSLEGAPTKVGSGFYCNYNKLTNLEGAPTEVGEDFWCEHNKVKFTKADVRKVSKVKDEIIT